MNFVNGMKKNNLIRNLQSISSSVFNLEKKRDQSESDEGWGLWSNYSNEERPKLFPFTQIDIYKTTQLPLFKYVSVIHYQADKYLNFMRFGELFQILLGLIVYIGIPKLFPPDF